MNVPASESEIPNEPKITNTSETKRPIHSSDLRQKITAPTARNTREASTSTVREYTAYVSREMPRRWSACIFAGVGCQILQCPNVDLVQILRTWPHVAPILAIKFSSSTSAR